MKWIAVVLLAAGCTAATEPTQPAQTAVMARIRGVVVNARNTPVAEATVNVAVRPAQPDGICGGDEGAQGSGLTNEQGQFDIAVRWTAPDRDLIPCVVVTANAGGTTGTMTGRLNSPSFDVQLARAPNLTQREAERLIGDVIAAIEGDPEAPARLASYVWGGRRAVEGAARDLRQHLGEDITAREIDNDPLQSGPRHTFRLVGHTGRTTDVVVRQEETIRLTNPFLFYAEHARRFMERLISLVLANDAMSMSRLLNPDDVDVPVPEAQRVIDDFRRRYDPETLGATLVSWNERRSQIRYKLTGSKDGKKREEIIVLVYGDGLLGWKR